MPCAARAAARARPRRGASAPQPAAAFLAQTRRGYAAVTVTGTPERLEVPESASTNASSVTSFTLAPGKACLDVRTVADLMGHSSTRTTQDVYQHVSDERRREGAKRISDALLG